MDYLDMSHLVGDERYHDRLTYDGLWENNLYQFFRIVLPKVSSICQDRSYWKREGKGMMTHHSMRLYENGHWEVLIVIQNTDK